MKGISSHLPKIVHGDPDHITDITDAVFDGCSPARRKESEISRAPECNEFSVFICLSPTARI